jgi:hypothetical protein
MALTGADDDIARLDLKGDRRADGARRSDGLVRNIADPRRCAFEARRKLQMPAETGARGHRRRQGATTRAWSAAR